MSINNNTRKTIEEIIKDFDINQFTQFFRGKNRSFAPRREELIQYEDENFNSGLKLGEIKFDGADELLVCTFEVTQQLTERSGKKTQYEKAKKVLKETQSDAGIFIFFDRNGFFRFSLIYANYLGEKRDWSNFRRFTYYVSKELTNKTFLQRIGDGDFSSLEKIKDAFSVEKVTKEFYKDIANWYFLAIQKTKFPKDAESEDNGRNIAIIRLITRIIFIWFMRQRKLIPAKLFNYGELKKILKDLTRSKTTYYKAILQNLFFATLNTKIKNRKFRTSKTFQGKNIHYMDPEIYRYEDYFKNQKDMINVFKEIPFLNGGLFDCLDKSSKQNNNQGELRIDGFSDKDVGLKFPNYLFFAEEINANLSKELGPKYKKCKVHGLINILSAYNFTIDENDPNDQEVALDPELLGKVFENLLASFNPETSSTARKATGSYYTPREIVDYMVTQSLKEYFKTHLTDTDNINDNLEILFSSDKQENPFKTKETNLLVNLIDDLRIVDPAVGSGAFPMVILNKLVFILSKLDPESNIWKETQMSAVEKSITDPVLRNKLKEHVAYQFEEKNFDYGRKLYLIQKCIYGVDIQQIAVEIAKLRFFIALLVDENIDKTKDNWDIEPLPNLDFKIMQGNSLIEEYEGIKLIDERFFKDQISKDEILKELQDRQNELQKQYIHLHKNKKLTTTKKFEIEKELTRVNKALNNYKLRSKDKNDVVGLFGMSEIQMKAKQLLDMQKQYFAIDLKKEKDVLKDKIEKLSWELIEETLKEQNKEDKILELNKFRKSNTKPFFLWKLYFAELFLDDNPGFDIVIGNPPYVRQENLDTDFKNLMKGNYPEVANGIADLYVYFFAIAFKLLKSKGTITLITPNKYLKTKYGLELRNTLKKYQVDKIIDFFELPVFEAANDTAITIVKNEQEVQTTKYFPVRSLNNLDLNILTKSDYLTAQKNNTEWIFIDSIQNQIFEKVYKNSIPLKDFVKDKIFSGIKTAFNKAFVLSKESADELLQTESKKVIKKYAQSTAIKKWEILDKEKYFLATDYDIDIPKKYPSAFKYLKQFKKPLMRRLDQGRNWWNLRACTYYNEFEKPKIIYMHTAKKHEFYLDTEGYYINNSCYMIVSDNRFLFCFLNSKFFEWFKRLKFVAYGDAKGSGRCKLDYNKMITVPIKKISKSDQQPFTTLVDQILAITKDKDFLSSQEKQSKVKELEKEIDELVYELYGLSEKEKKIVEGNERSKKNK